MKIIINYEEFGFPVTEFNYENERDKFLSFYYNSKNDPLLSKDNEHKKWAHYSTELAIDMLRVLVVEKLVDPKDLVFVYKDKCITMDDYAIFNTDSEDKSIIFDFCSMSEKIARRIMECRSLNRRNELLKH